MTETAPLAPQARRRALTAILASLTAAGLTFGTSFPLFSVLLDRAGQSSSIIGLHAAMPSILVEARESALQELQRAAFSQKRRSTGEPF